MNKLKDIGIFLLGLGVFIASLSWLISMIVLFVAQMFGYNC